MSAHDPEAVPPPVRAAALDLRVLRALPFATVCVLLAAAAHMPASGSTVPLSAILLGWVATAVAAALGARRERSLPAITGGLGAAQLALHFLFHAAQPSAAQRSLRPQAMADMPGMAGMPGMPGMGSAGTGLGAHPYTAAVPHATLWFHSALLGLSPAMLGAHLAATLLAGWWLRRGEAAVWRLVRGTADAASAAAHAYAAPLRAVLALFAAVEGGLGHARPAPTRQHAWPGGYWRLPSPVLLRHSVIRRGPPAAPAVHPS
ncbi:hypothetical protein [Kitasatospora sp. MAP5-34]|uniref:hypothetical protein n=1 Tax=Kitasatospora sp. MAP5-34 TaxID=3035102 RepID=UPI00247397DE|nr:hypothetical protein [Kitasatospora sp. MAP5-34]MDH6577833.1 hypothetical protein [Kitasatospora sp. MAP5-34]